MRPCGVCGAALRRVFGARGCDAYCPACVDAGREGRPYVVRLHGRLEALLQANRDRVRREQVQREPC